MHRTTTQPSLLSRVRDLDDHAAWREFDGQYRELILRYCRRRGLQASDAEDVRQMVMLNLARQLRSFRYEPARGRFRGYLGRTVANAIHRYYRSPRADVRGLRTSAAEQLPDESRQEQDREWETEWMLHHYRLAMQSVREVVEPRSLEVFEHLVAGEAPDEVAEQFGMTRDAVHKVKQRIRGRLERLVAEQVQQEEEPGIDARG